MRLRVSLLLFRILHEKKSEITFCIIEIHIHLCVGFSINSISRGRQIHITIVRHIIQAIAEDDHIAILLIFVFTAYSVSEASGRQNHSVGRTGTVLPGRRRDQGCVGGANVHFVGMRMDP